MGFFNLTDQPDLYTVVVVVSVGDWDEDQHLTSASALMSLLNQTCGKEGAVSRNKAPDLSVNIRSHSHLRSWFRPGSHLVQTWFLSSMVMRSAL